MDHMILRLLHTLNCYGINCLPSEFEQDQFEFQRNIARMDAILTVQIFLKYRPQKGKRVIIEYAALESFDNFSYNDL